MDHFNERHLNYDQLESYRRRTLLPDALLEADRHLAQCEQCRAKLPGAGAARHMSALIAATGSPHLSFEDLEAYANGTLQLADRPRVITHLDLCPACRDEA